MIVAGLEQCDKMSTSKETATDDNEQVMFIHAVMLTVHNSNMSLSYYTAPRHDTAVCVSDSIIRLCNILYFTISTDMLKTIVNACILQNCLLKQFGKKCAF